MSKLDGTLEAFWSNPLILQLRKLRPTEVTINPEVDTELGKTQTSAFRLLFPDNPNTLVL